jgi:hypothetical protein
MPKQPDEPTLPVPDDELIRLINLYGDTVEALAEANHLHNVTRIAVVDALRSRGIQGLHL